MAAPTIPSLTNLPSKGDPATFHAKADALWTQINTLAAQLNAYAAYFNTLQFPSLATYGIGISTVAAQDIGNIDSTATAAGRYRFTATTTGSNPTGVSFGIVDVLRYDASNMTQMIWGNFGTKIRFWRRYDSGAWGSWLRMDPEYGSNASGTYIRFPDGTQICTCTPSPTIACDVATGGGYTSAAQTVPFPAAFLSTSGLQARASVPANGTRWCGVQSTSTTQAIVTQNSWTQQTGLQSATVVAIGRYA